MMKSKQGNLLRGGQKVINAYENGNISATILAGYFKFGAATIIRGFNGATAIVEVLEDEDEY